MATVDVKGLIFNT